MNERRELVAGFDRRNSHRAVGVEHFGKDLIDVRYSCLTRVSMYRLGRQEGRTLKSEKLSASCQTSALNGSYGFPHATSGGTGR